MFPNLTYLRVDSLHPQGAVIHPPLLHGFLLVVLGLCESVSCFLCWFSFHFTLDFWCWKMAWKKFSALWSGRPLLALHILWILVVFTQVVTWINLHRKSLPLPGHGRWPWFCCFVIAKRLQEFEFSWMGGYCIQRKVRSDWLFEASEPLKILMCEVMKYSSEAEWNLPANQFLILCFLSSFIPYQTST